MSFQNEKNEILKFLLSKRFFDQELFDVELIITPECNKKCEYCYLYKYENDLYPKEIRDKKIIKNNLKILLNYFYANNFKINHLDLFSGEIWNSKFGIEILNIILDIYSINSYPLSKKIVIPSNMSFVNSKYISEIEILIQKFSNIDVNLIFSASIDGKILDQEQRKFIGNKQIENDEYYDKIFQFCSKYSFGTHPMIYSENVKLWKNNFNWYMENLKKHNINFVPMMLEVRNENWTQTTIDEYCDFLQYLINYFYTNYSEKEFIKAVFGRGGNYQYLPIRLNETGEKYCCSIQNTFVIRVGDLAIAPCHRTSYNNFNYGRFILDENQDKIIDIEANNISLANYILCSNPNICAPKCNTCPYKYICIKGCLGSQYEYSGNILQPIESVCDMLQQKYNFLYKTYKKMNLFEKAKKIAEEMKDTDKENSKLILYNLNTIETFISHLKTEGVDLDNEL